MKRKENRKTIYLNKSDYTKLEYLKTLWLQKYNTEISSSKLISTMMNSSSTLDSLCNKISGETTNEKTDKDQDTK